MPWPPDADARDGRDPDRRPHRLDRGRARGARARHGRRSPRRRAAISAWSRRRHPLHPLPRRRLADARRRSPASRSAPRSLPVARLRAADAGLATRAAIGIGQIDSLGSGRPRRRARPGLRGLRPRARPHAAHPAAHHRRRRGRPPLHRIVVDLLDERSARWTREQAEAHGAATSPRDNPTLTDIAAAARHLAAGGQLPPAPAPAAPPSATRCATGRPTSPPRPTQPPGAPHDRLAPAPCASCLRPRSPWPSAIPSPTSCCRPTRWCATRRARTSCCCTSASSPPSAGRRSASPLEPLLLLLIAASHFAIDWLKLRHGSGSFGPFVIDQAAHLAMIALGAALFPGAWAAGLWAHARPARFALPAAGDGARRRLRLHRLGRRLRRRAR